MPSTIYKLEYAENLSRVVDPHKIPVSVIVPARNEAHNLDRCLRSLREFGEVYVIDSGSTDATVEIAASYNANVVQFRYGGGWPKKRQWAMDSLPLACDWILLVDADEAMTPELSAEIKQAIRRVDVTGFYIDLQMHFLGRRLRHCGANFEKLSLFRRTKARFECRVRDQNISMCDMEVHEHLIAEGKTAKLKNLLIHNNVESLFRYIQKHNEYSNWEAKVWASQAQTELQPSIVGSQAQKRRWLRKKLFRIPGSSFMFFLYKYFFRLGFLDGVPGLIYCGFQGIQFFHIKSKIYELQVKQSTTTRD